METYRACEVCGHTDVKTDVACSGYGAFSFNYCHVCLPMGAEPKGIGSTVEFSKEKDEYYNSETGETIPIKTKDGREFRTRKEYVDSRG